MDLTQDVLAEVNKLYKEKKPENTGPSLLKNRLEKPVKK